MDKAKQWIALTVVGVLAVLAAGWFLLISPKRTEASDVRDLVSAQESTNTGLQGQIARLKQQQKELPAQQARLAAIAAKIPDNPALPALVRALTKAADSAGVELVSMAPSPPAPVTAAAPTAVTPAAGTSSGTGAAAPTGTTAAPAAAPVALQSIGMNIQVVGGFFQVEQFVDELERLTRAFKTTSLSMVPGESPAKPKTSGSATAVQDGRSLRATIMGNVYLASGRTSVPVPAAPVK